jgi:hypothetical protein
MYPVGSSVRSLLAWWRSAQFADVTGVNAGYAESVRHNLEAAGNEPEVVSYFAGAIRSARPSIIDVERDGSFAVVYSRILFRQPIGLTRYVVVSVPHAFRLVREQGRWVLADDTYMETSLPKSLRTKTQR